MKTNEQEKNELKRDLLESLRKTPRDPRHLAVITYDKRGVEQHTSFLSMNRVDSSFTCARRELQKLLKKQRIEQTIGWENGQVIVLTEKYWDIPKNYLEEHPEKRDELYKYGFVDKKQLVTKFYIQKNGSDERRVYYHYGRIEKDGDWTE